MFEVLNSCSLLTVQKNQTTTSNIARNHIFKRIFFSTGTSLKLIDCEETKQALGGSAGMLPRKNFEKLHAVMAILVLFE